MDVVVNINETMLQRSDTDGCGITSLYEESPLQSSPLAQGVVPKRHGTFYSPTTPLTIDDAVLVWITNALRAQFMIGGSAEDMYRVMANVEECIREHRKDPSQSKITRILGNVDFITQLPIEEAFRSMDKKYHITHRRHLAPSIHEVRQTVNLAQVLVSAKNLKLITFDGDETLYPNGNNFSDPELAVLITQLLRHGCHVALVTAAGYGTIPTLYEKRLDVLVHTLRMDTHLTDEEKQHFWVFGGEANYLFRLGPDAHLHHVPYSEWKHHSPIDFTQENHAKAANLLLDIAERTLHHAVADLACRAEVVRKQRAVGVIPGGERGLERAPQGSGAKRIRTEILEEFVARVREAVAQVGEQFAQDSERREPPWHIPYCAFNGGSDVWVDVGNKAMALQVMQSMLLITPCECLHVGDQFTESGNDLTVRQQSPCIWVANPVETKAVIRRLMREVRQSGNPIVPSASRDALEQADEITEDNP